MTVRDIERKTNENFIVMDNITGDIIFSSANGLWVDYKAIRDLEVSGMCIDGDNLILGVWRNYHGRIS